MDLAARASGPEWLSRRSRGHAGHLEPGPGNSARNFFWVCPAHSIIGWGLCIKIGAVANRLRVRSSLLIISESVLTLWIQARRGPCIPYRGRENSQKTIRAGCASPPNIGDRGSVAGAHCGRDGPPVHDTGDGTPCGTLCALMQFVLGHCSSRRRILFARERTDNSYSMASVL